MMATAHILHVDINMTPPADCIRSPDCANIFSMSDDVPGVSLVPEGYMEPQMMPSGLKERKTSHSHICPVCHKNFFSSKGLQQHQIIHTDQKPFVCSICQKAFRFKSNLFEHKSLHANVQPYVCQLCGKSCRLKGNLKKHLKTHQKNGENFDLEKACREIMVQHDATAKQLKSKEELDLKTLSSWADAKEDEEPETSISDVHNLPLLQSKRLQSSQPKTTKKRPKSGQVAAAASLESPCRVVLSESHFDFSNTSNSILPLVFPLDQKDFIQIQQRPVDEVKLVPFEGLMPCETQEAVNAIVAPDQDGSVHFSPRNSRISANFSMDMSLDTFAHWTNSLWTEFRRFLPDVTYECSICGMKKDCWKELDRHYHEKHPGEYFCSICRKHFEVKEKLLKHFEFHAMARSLLREPKLKFVNGSE